MMNATSWKRIAVRRPDGSFIFFDPGEIFYLEAADNDTFIRTAGRKRHRFSPDCS